MRLYVKKGAHAVLSRAACRKFGALARVWRDMGHPALVVRTDLRTWAEKDGRSPSNACYASKRTTAKSKNPVVLSESIGKIRIQPMYAGANMGQPSRPNDGGWEIKCSRASDLIWTSLWRCSAAIHLVRRLSLW